ncbi:PAS domain-containing protein [Candidatus Obscuribacterales bacterium]|nr:PAS domain-containing protein [Candidatus Obscuribacterales bacterium]MBX3138871.1 PAS domain-containing protein [Candidatus Obscuribacterales bacterium]MBX3152659.1 PAS domain-containing protein [Candidatus Obscuribacterales bacterium]
MEVVLIVSTCALALLAWRLNASLRDEKKTSFNIKTDLENCRRELEETNQSLLQKTKEFHVLTDALSPVVWTATADGLIDFYSRRWDEYTGLNFRDTSGNNWQQVVHPDDLSPCMEHWSACLKTGESFQFEYRWRGQDNVYRWFLAQAESLRDQDGKILKWFGTSTNVDVLKRHAELLEQEVNARTRELTESERKFKAIFDHTFQLIGLLDPDGRVIDVNQTALDYQNTTSKQVHGQFFWETPWFAHSEEVKKQIRDAVTSVSQGDFVRFEVDHLKPSGEPALVDFSMKPVFGENRTVKYLIPEGRDITERKVQEEKLRSIAEKLASSNHDLQQFAYVASHDLQEPLRTVISFSNLLKKKAGDSLSADAQKYLDVIVESVERMQQLIRDLLLYARVETQGQALVPVDLNVPINEAIKSLETLINETQTEIVFDAMPEVIGDSSQLSRLFQNLINNSIKFRSDKLPKIKIRVTEENGHAKLSICDNGIGISMEYAERIFEIFQRLHSINQYPGTGIGLSVCRKIVERHGGHISLQPSDEGTTFVLTLPLSPKTVDNST